MEAIATREEDALPTERKSLARVIRELGFAIDDEFGEHEQRVPHAHADDFSKTSSSSLSRSTKRSSTRTTATTILWMNLLLTIAFYTFVSEFRFVTNILNRPLRPPRE